MRPIRPGDRGPAVEDIQRRLLALGYDLGITGVDGVFLGRTLEQGRELLAKYGATSEGYCVALERFARELFDPEAPT